jgi:hypothetical protein
MFQDTMVRCCVINLCITYNVCFSSMDKEHGSTLVYFNELGKSTSYDHADA